MNKVWQDDAWEDYLYWQMQDSKTLKRINQLLKDIDRNGLTASVNQSRWNMILKAFGAGELTITTALYIALKMDKLRLLNVVLITGINKCPLLARIVYIHNLMIEG